jgi:hypothetical protein
LGLENKFVGAYEAVRRLSDGLKGLSANDSRYSAIVEQLGGYRQISRVIPLIKQFEDAERAKNVAISGGLSLQAAAEQRQEALAQKIAKVKEEYLQLFRTLVDSKGFQGTADAVLKAASAFGVLLDKLSPLIPLLATLATIKLATNLGAIAQSGLGAFTAPVGSTFTRVRRAGGGMVEGPEGRDVIPASLTRGEYVIRREAAEKIGYGKLDSMNRQGFALGGRVGYANGGSAFEGLTPEQLKRVEEAITSGLYEKVVNKNTKRGGGLDVENIVTDTLARASKSFDPAKNPDLEFSTHFQQNVKLALQDARRRKTPLGADELVANIPERSGGRTAETEAELAAMRAKVEQVTGQPFVVRTAVKKERGEEVANAIDLAAQGKAVGVVGHNLSREELTNQVVARFQQRIRAGEGQSPPPPPGVATGGQGPRQFGPIRDRTQALTLSGFDQLGLPGRQLDALTRDARILAAEMGKLDTVMDGFTKVVVRTKGGLAEVVGLKDTGPRSTLGPASPASPFGLIPSPIASFGGHGAFPAGPSQPAVDAAVRRDLEERARANQEAKNRDAQRLSGFLTQYPDRESGLQREQRRLQELSYQDAQVVAARSRPQLQAQKQDAINELAARRVRSQQRDQDRDFVGPVFPRLSPDRFSAQVGLGAGQRARDEEFRYQQLYGPASPGLFGRAGSAVGRAGAGLLNRFGGVGQRAAFAGIVGLPFLSDFVDRQGGDVNAAAAGSGSRYRTARGVGGALQGVAIGATVGSVLPGVGTVIGAAVGAVAGGLVGLVTSLNEASADISKAKVNSALTSFADKVQAINAGLSGGALANVDSGAIQAAREQLRAASTEQSAINREAATHTFSGFNSDEFNALQKKSDRQNFGQQLPGIASVLNRQADQLGRAKVGENAQKLSEQLANGGEGLNREFVQLVANLRGVSISQVVTELKKNIEAGQRAAKTEEASRKGRQVQDQDINSFGRFVSAIEAAADSLDQLRTRASLLNEVFDGTINASKVNLGGKNLDQLGRPDRGALEPLNALASVGGEPGRRLRAAGGVADDLARVLPGVLTDVLRNPKGEQDQSVQIGEGVVRALGFQPGKVPDEVQRGISVLQGAASKLSGEKGPEGLLEKGRTDVTKLAEELLSGFADPIKDAGRKGADALQAQVQEFLDGLATVARQMQAVGQLEDQLSDIRQGNFRTNLQFAATVAGRPGQAFDNVPVAQLEQNLTDKQRRLAPDVANPFDPVAIAARLADVRERLGPAEGRVQSERQNPSGAAFKGAAEEAVRLKAESANLVQALKNLANVTERTAVLQDKLNRFQQERDSRIGLAERYATADLAQRAQLNYGLLLANRANNLGQANGGDFKGVLDKFGVEEVRAIIDFLRGAGGTTFKGFQGGPRADDLLRKLLEGSGGIGGLDAQQAAAEAADRKEFQQRQADAEAAQKALAEAQAKLPSELKNTLTNLQANFFARLEAVLAQTLLSDVQNKQTSTGIDLKTAEERKTQAGTLTGLGFASGAQVKENAEAVNKYLDTTKVILEHKARVGGVDALVNASFGRDNTDEHKPLLGLGRRYDQGNLGEFLSVQFPDLNETPATGSRRVTRTGRGGTRRTARPSRRTGTTLSRPSRTS